MDVQELTAQARDALTVKRVFGEPYEKDGLTIIPAARVQGAVGGGVAARTRRARAKGVRRRRRDRPPRRGVHRPRKAS